MRGRKVIVKDDRVDISLLGHFSKFVDFARTDIGGWIGFVAILQCAINYLKGGSAGQVREFFERFSGAACGDTALRHPNENSTSYALCVKDMVHVIS